MKEKKEIKILILVICVLLSIIFKLVLEITSYEDLPNPISATPTLFSEAIETIQTKQIEEYELWINNAKKEEEYRNKWYREISLDEKYQKYIYEWSIMLGLDYNLLLAIAYHESRFNPNAINRSNSNGTVDYGLFQVNSSNFRWVEELAKKEMDVVNDVYDNILGGILIFNFYWTYWENQGLEGAKLKQYSLNSYNAGIQGYSNMGFVSRSYDRNIVKTKKEIENK